MVVVVVKCLGPIDEVLFDEQWVAFIASGILCEQRFFSYVCVPGVSGMLGAGCKRGSSSWNY